MVTGLIVEKTGFYFLAFLTAGTIAAIGAASYISIIGPVVQIDWAKVRTATAVRR